MAVSAFLDAVQHVLQTGAATEHSYRPAFKDVFEALLPNVVALNEPTRDRFGAPDFLLLHNSLAVGYVEVKKPDAPLQRWVTESSNANPVSTEAKQLKRYRAALPNVLFTDGLLWFWFADGELRGDPLQLATLAGQQINPVAGAAAELEQLLQQFALSAAPAAVSPRDLAARLAAIARWLNEVMVRVFQQEMVGDSLHRQFVAFKDTLLPNLTPEQFADMYAQTIVYGLFAARVSHSGPAPFSRHAAAQAIPRTNPFLRQMFQQIAGYDIDPAIEWLVEDCAYILAHTDMQAVMRDFGRATRQEDPVVHFYETFLAAYDPKLRESRGVYYTPEPVVEWIVRSVHQILKRDFGKSLGLADQATIILDPATGTGTFLHRTIQYMHAELADQGLAGSWNSYVSDHLLKQVFGFELLMAPYTVAHLKLGLLLSSLGYTFQSNERLGVYLTNALADAPTLQSSFAFADQIVAEARAADEVKHQKPVMVVIGNPPYSGHSANKDSWITDLLRGVTQQGRTTESYYEVDDQPLGERNPKWLNDDYVKFIRFGQWRISQTGEGVLAYISNNGYLDNPTFRGMRQSLLKEFDQIYIVNLHGNSKKKERTPTGAVDQNVFDIQQGVAIGIFVKYVHSSSTQARVFYADLWGQRQAKYQALAQNDLNSLSWQQLEPQSPWYLFVPQDTEFLMEYEQYKKVTDIFPTNSVGVVTSRDTLTIHWNEERVFRTVTEFASLSVEAARQVFTLGKDARDWQVALAQADLHTTGVHRGYIKPIMYRPFDTRYTYYTGKTRGFFSMPRSEVMQHMVQKANIALVTTRQLTTIGFNHLLCAEHMIELKTCSHDRNTNLFPLYLYPDTTSAEPSMFDSAPTSAPGGRRPNLSQPFIQAVAANLQLQWVADGKGDRNSTVGPEDIFHYLYAVFHAPTYRERYAEFLKIDFPRLPLTTDRERWWQLVDLGAQLVDLHLLRTPGRYAVGGAGGAAILAAPGDAGLAFPIAGDNMVTKPRYLEPSATEAGRVAINATQYFSGIDPETWQTPIGGYQPLHKWLKDRKGRTLSFDEIMHYQRMVLALRETNHLMQVIDNTIADWETAFTNEQSNPEV